MSDAWRRGDGGGGKGGRGRWAGEWKMRGMMWRGRRGERGWEMRRLWYKENTTRRASVKCEERDRNH